jgi:hypothetical protein
MASMRSRFSVMVSMTVVILMLGVITPAHAATRTISGSIQLSHGGLVNPERTLYVQNGCAQDVRDGALGAFIDVRPFEFIKVTMGTPGRVVQGAAPRLYVKMYLACGITEPFATYCFAMPSCILPVSGHRYVEVTTSSGTLDTLLFPFADIPFTLTGTF